MLSMTLLMRIAEVIMIGDIARRIKRDLSQGEMSKIRDILNTFKTNKKDILKFSLKGAAILIILENIIIKVISLM